MVSQALLELPEQPAPSNVFSVHDIDFHEVSYRKSKCKFAKLRLPGVSEGESTAAVNNLKLGEETRSNCKLVRNPRTRPTVYDIFLECEFGCERKPANREKARLGPNLPKFRADEHQEGDSSPSDAQNSGEGRHDHFGGILMQLCVSVRFGLECCTCC